MRIPYTLIIVRGDNRFINYYLEVMLLLSHNNHQSFGSRNIKRIKKRTVLL